VAIAGPLVSLGLAGIFLVLSTLDPIWPFAGAASLYLMRINLLLAIFNLLPGFPLDGGRVLRALLWKFSSSFRRATRAATLTGQVTAFGFIAYGFFTTFNGQVFSGLWIVFIGWFLMNAAYSAFSELNWRSGRAPFKVTEAMQTNVTRLPGQISISQLINEWVLAAEKRDFFIMEDGELRGVVTLPELASVSQENWQQTTLDQVMIPRDQLTLVTVETDLHQALKAMEQTHQTQMTVLQAGEPVGILSRERAENFLASLSSSRR
jgi:CBS domain-containing protein